MSNSLDPDKTQYFVLLELGPNYLQITSRQRVLRSCSRQYFFKFCPCFMTHKRCDFYVNCLLGGNSCKRSSNILPKNLGILQNL